MIRQRLSDQYRGKLRGSSRSAIREWVISREVNTIEAKYRSAEAFIHQLVSQLRSHVPAADIEEPPIDIESAL